MSDADDLVLARAGLLRCCEPPAPAVASLVASTGEVLAWQLIRARRAPGPVLAATSARLDAMSAAEVDRVVGADIESAAAVGARLIGPGDAEWPVEAFAGFGTDQSGRSSPPLALYVRGGTLAGLPALGMTVVGSRASTGYGQRVAAEVSLAAVRAGLTVVSGAAFGIDTVAHRAAFAEGNHPGGRPATVAVLACGIDRAYPTANRELIERIAQVGAVVSEYAPGTSPARHRFLVRNRLIAALGAGTVVVEAGRRSGTLSTASAADALGRLVMAVPGPVTSALSVGCHLLVTGGMATLVTGADDVLRLLGHHPSDSAALLPPDATERRHPTDGLHADAARVFDALSPRTVRTVSELAIDSGVQATAVMGALAVLDLNELVVRTPDGWRRTAPRR